jgi:hypothetical protein
MVKQRKKEDEQGVITVNGHSIDKQSVTVDAVKNHVTKDTTVACCTHSECGINECVVKT